MSTESPALRTARIAKERHDASNDAARRHRHFTWKCDKCFTEFARRIDPGIGDWDRPQWHKIHCCKTDARFTGISEPQP